MGYQQDEANTRFGRELSRIRRLSGFTQARISRDVGCSQTHIGNIERGLRTPPLRLVKDLDQTLHADGRLERLWAQLTSDGEPAWLDDLAHVEREALTIMEMHTTLLSTLLQTEGYARAVTRVTSSWAPYRVIEETVRKRMERAARFRESELPTYRAVIDEAALRRRWGDVGVMRAQLRHLAELVDEGRIIVQIAEATAGHPGLSGPFTLISSSTSPDVVYVESAHGGHMLDDVEIVQRYRVIFSDIQGVALSPEQSLLLLRNEMEQLSDA